MNRNLRIITLTPWSRGDGSFCLGVGITDARHIAEELEDIGQNSITVISNLSRHGPPELTTQCNITETFTTTCNHLGNADIAAFIEEYGTEVRYGSVLIQNNEGLTIRILNRG